LERHFIIEVAVPVGKNVLPLKLQLFSNYWQWVYIFLEWY